MHPQWSKCDFHKHSLASVNIPGYALLREESIQCPMSFALCTGKIMLVGKRGRYHQQSKHIWKTDLKESHEMFALFYKLCQSDYIKLYQILMIVFVSDDKSSLLPY